MAAIAAQHLIHTKDQHLNIYLGTSVSLVSVHTYMLRIVNFGCLELQSCRPPCRSSYHRFYFLLASATVYL